jgi:drug/metabolite transporter (DMT)-like permease
LLSAVYGLLAALSWGSGDFAGGLASRKTGPWRTVLYGEAIGLVLLFVVIAANPEPLPDTLTWFYAILAGALGTLGLMCLYMAMTQGKMSIAAPVSALLAAGLPVLVGAFTEGLVDLLTFLGFATALAAVWFVSQGDGDVKSLLNHLADLRLPLLAGLGFGAYFVTMNVATRDATYWPMVAGRASGLAIIFVFILLRRDGWAVQREAWPILGVNGVLDVGGNFFYILAGQTGRMDVAAVLASLFPATTVLLARIVLGERLSRRQAFGVALALLAILLLTV